MSRTHSAGPDATPANSQALACRLLVIVPDYRDFLQIHAQLGPSKIITLSWVANITEALESSRKADLVLWQPNRADPGAEAAIRVLSGHLGVPVVVLSAPARESEARQMILAGAADYLARKEIGRPITYRCLSRCWHRQSARKVQETRAGTDALTGLPIRGILVDRTQQALLRAQEEEQSVILAVVNLSGFRRINQTYGFEQGDQVVREVARRLEEILKPADTLARVGADEFAILMPDRSDTESLDDVGVLLSSVFEQPLYMQEERLDMRAAIGLACYPESGEDAEQLLGNAHLAMSEARQRRATGVHVYEPSMRKALSSSMTLDNEFRLALRRDELAVHYQPKLDIHTGEVTGVEALVRWPHPTRGMIMPGDFVPAAERTGMIIPMGYWVLKKACEDLSVLQSLGFEDLVCAVNLSFRQFHDRKLSETVFRIIYNTEVDTSSFEFELTESSMLFDLEYTRRCLTELSHLGIRFALDDFGTGYSSFSTLRNLPISTVKIDRSFVEHLVEQSQDAALVSGMISLAHRLGLTVVAEGVETREQMDFLKEHQCDQIQGYYIAKPLALKELSEFLVQQRDAPHERGAGVA